MDSDALIHTVPSCFNYKYLEELRFNPLKLKLV
jgi:hypothetical protein